MDERLIKVFTSWETVVGVAHPNGLVYSFGAQEQIPFYMVVNKLQQLQDQLRAGTLKSYSMRIEADSESKK